MSFTESRLAVVLFATLVAMRLPAADASSAVRTIEPREAAAAALEVTPQRYPDADSVLVDAVTQEHFNPDGTSLALSEEYFKVLTEKGRREAQTQTFFFALPYDTVTVVRAWILKPDGRCVTVNVERASRTMTETGQMGANIYDPNQKLLQLSLAGLEIGDLVHYATRRQTLKPRVPDMWSDYAVFEYTSPIRRMTYAISEPPERPLRHLELRDPLSNTVTSAETVLPDGRKLRRWELRDVPQLFPEPEMPPAHTVAQRLLLSTAADWPSLSRWYWNLCLPRLQAVTPEMGLTVTGLMSRASSRNERVQHIFTWVSQSIRYMGITTETEAPGYEPHDVSMTFSNRYGVCRDKAALLVAMLRLAGIEAYPVLINVGAKLDGDVPMTFFNHAIVAAARPGEDAYDLMDPTNESARDLFPSYLGNRSYMVAHPRGETLRVSPVVPAASNLLRVVSRGDLDETGRLSLRTEIAFDGINDNLYRGHLARLPREQRRRFFEGLVKARMAGAELTSFELAPEDLQDTAQALRATLECRVRDFAVQGDGLTLLEFPWLSGSLGYVNFLLGNTGLKQRRFALVTEVACGTDERLEVDLSAAAGAPRQLPDNVSTACAGIVYSRGVECSNGLLRASSRFLLERPEYPAADYPALKAIRRDMEYAARQRAHFAPGAAASAPDARILEDRLSIEVTSPQTWSSTHRRVIRILTFAGKKRNAEIKLDFNPCWQTARLLSAVVSNADGSVHSIKPEEINIMDAPWTGSAPRYPAAKTMVISLPGVETGSVVAVTTQRTQTQAPFFALQHAFRRFDPVDEATLELTAPRALPLRLRQPGAPVNYRCVTNRDTITHSWRAASLPAVAREDALPPWHAFTPTLLASAGNWEDYAAGLEKALARALQNDANAAALARRLTRRTRDPHARARLVRDYVMTAIRPAGPRFIDLPQGFTPADTTLADGYGHDADRAILMMAMLRAAGLDAEPMLADSGQLDTPLVDALFAQPQPDLFDAWLIAARPRASWWRRVLPWTGGDETPDARLPLYLNDGDQYAEPGTTAFFRHPALTLTGARTYIDVAAPYRPRGVSEWSVTLDDVGTARIAVTNRYNGPACGAFRRQFRELPPEERARHFQELVGAISQSAAALGELETDLESYPGEMRYRVRAERYAVRERDSLTLLVPGAAGPLLDLRADKRENPLYIGDFADGDWTCRVWLPPETLAVPVLPPEIDWELPAGLGRLRCTTTLTTLPDGRRLIALRREVRRGSGVLAPELYPALLEMNRRLTHPSMRTVVARIRE
ncbi:MAG: DUF3857 domain-containing protein [Kiritimatiellae bacterium]|nr:DUF3857 domain-containing protein [Kiritimatiellia bacterium]